MAYSITYNAAFSTGPAKTEKLGLAYVHINDARVAFQERLKSEHEFDLTHNASQGFHKEGSARAFLQANAPTVSEQTALASATADLNSGRVWIASGNGSVFYQTLANANVAGWTAVNAVKREGDTSTALAGNLVYNFLTYSDTLTHESQLIFKKSHWDTAAHAVTLTGEALGSVWAYGDSGSAFTQAGYIQFVQNGAAGAQTPADLVVYLSNGTATAEKFRVSAAGLVTMADLTVTNAISGSITGNAATVTAANEATDTSCFLGFVTAATGDLGLKTSTSLTFNSATGRLGLGGSSSVGARLLLSGTVVGATDCYGVQDQETIGSGVTSSFRGFQTSLSTEAASFTLPSLYHFFVAGPTVGSGSTVTNQYGFYVHSNLTTAGTNYAFYGLVPASGTARWNCYMAGTAPNYFAGTTYFNTPTSVAFSGVTPRVQINSNSYAGASIGMSSWSNDVNASYLFLGKSRGGTVGTNAIVQDGDFAGSIYFCADDGTDLYTPAALIGSRVCGTPAANNVPGCLVFYTNSGTTSATEKMRLLPSGHLLLSASAPSTEVAVASPTAADFQNHTTGGHINMALARHSADAYGAYLMLGKSRGAVGTPTVVQNGDDLGAVFFSGADGTDLQSQGAYILAKVSGTPGSNDLPTDLVFGTTPDGSSASTEKLRITSDGRLYGTALHNNAGAVTGATNQYIASGTYTPTFTAGTNSSATSTVVHQFNWIRIGNIVSVCGQVDVNFPTTGWGYFALSLPIASELADEFDLSGTVNVVEEAAFGIVYGDATNNRLQINLYGGSAAVHPFRINFSYEVLA